MQLYILETMSMPVLSPHFRRKRSQTLHARLQHRLNLLKKKLKKGKRLAVAHIFAIVTFISITPWITRFLNINPGIATWNIFTSKRQKMWIVKHRFGCKNTARDRLHKKKKKSNKYFLLNNKYRCKRYFFFNKGLKKLHLSRCKNFFSKHLQLRRLHIGMLSTHFHNFPLKRKFNWKTISYIVVTFFLILESFCNTVYPDTVNAEITLSVS